MLIDRTNDPIMRLLVDATRRADTSGPALARAHREVGRALAGAVAGYLPLEEIDIDHVAGKSTGVRVRPGGEPIFVALLRAGLFLAEGLWECFPNSALVLHGGRTETLAPLPAAGRAVVVVDAVINTGRSLRAVLDEVLHAGPAKTVVVTLVGFRPTVEALSVERPEIDIVAARLSDRSYVGRGTTDTGGRLFGTTSWETEPRPCAG
jgi:uracil phosphoribosyltransferase